jgi:hypothetical protein
MNKFKRGDHVIVHMLWDKTGKTEVERIVIRDKGKVVYVATEDDYAKARNKHHKVIAMGLRRKSILKVIESKSDR